MKRAVKLILMIFLLGAFIFPNQMIFAQQTEQCCSKSSDTSGCCDSAKSDSCHTSSQKTDSHNSCDGSCSCAFGCHANFTFSALKYETKLISARFFDQKNAMFGAESSFIFSVIQNIWQPPKIV